MNFHRVICRCCRRNFEDAALECRGGLMLFRAARYFICGDRTSSVLFVNVKFAIIHINQYVAMLRVVLLRKIRVYNESMRACGARTLKKHLTHPRGFFLRITHTQRGPTLFVLSLCELFTSTPLKMSFESIRISIYIYIYIYALSYVFLPLWSRSYASSAALFVSWSLLLPAPFCSCS